MGLLRILLFVVLFLLWVFQRFSRCKFFSYTRKWMKRERRVNDFEKSDKNWMMKSEWCREIRKGNDVEKEEKRLKLRYLLGFRVSLHCMLVSNNLNQRVRISKNSWRRKKKSKKKSKKMKEDAGENWKKI